MAEASDIWRPREEALDLLNDSLSEARAVTERAIAFPRDLAVELNRRAPDVLATTVATVLTKGHRFGLSCYSLALDGIGQEAGALFRLLIETWELLEYLRLDPSRVAEVEEARLPSAGDIAKRIDGKFKGLREHLNQHASHLSLATDATEHLVDQDLGQVRVDRRPSEEVLRQNMATISAAMVLVGQQGTLLFEQMDEVAARAWVDQILALQQDLALLSANES